MKNPVLIVGAGETSRAMGEQARALKFYRQFFF